MNKKYFRKYNVRLIGASKKVIQKAEDRELFKKSMSKIGLDTPRGFVINNIKEGTKILKKLSFPIIIRPSFTLGGSGGSTANSKKEYLNIIEKGLSLSPITEVLVEESLIGWKERI